MNKNLLKVAQETLAGLHEIGLVDQLTMRKFRALGLPEIKTFSPKKIKALRHREKISQPVLAELLNVSASTVKHWEIGDKHPSGAALKLLYLVEKKGVSALII